MSSRAELDQPTFPPAQFQSRVAADMYGFDPVNSVWRRLVLGPTGEIVVVFDPTPGTVVTTPADTIVGIGATVALPVPPADTRSMLVQNSGPAGTWVRVRAVGGAPGTGLLMPRLGEQPYGGISGSLAALEVEDVSLAVGGVAVATTITVQFQRD